MACAAAADGVVREVSRHDGVVGFNPYRKFRPKPADYVFVVASLATAAALVIWAMFG